MPLPLFPPHFPSPEDPLSARKGDKIAEVSNETKTTSAVLMYAMQDPSPPPPPLPQQARPRFHPNTASPTPPNHSAIHTRAAEELAVVGVASA